jgi:hypothetical protein
MKIKLLFCAFSLLVFGCSKSIDENIDKSTSYYYNSIDTSDYHRLNGSDTGGVDVTNTAPKYFTKLYGIKNSVPELFKYNVERNSLYGLRGGDTIVSHYVKVVNDSLFLNYDNPIYIGTFIDGKELEIIYSYYAKLRIRREYATQNFDSEVQRLGLLNELNLIGPDVNRNEVFFSTRADMKDSLDMVTWLNVKIKYTIANSK